MNRLFAAELRYLGYLLLVALLVGLVTGEYAWSLVAATVSYLCWSLYQLWRLEHWLMNLRGEAPPEASGVWGEIFENIYWLQKKHKREKKRLQAVVRRSQEINSALPDGIVQLDKRGNIDWFNANAGELLSLRKQDQGHPLVNYVRNPAFIDFFEEGEFELPIDLPAPNSQDTSLQYQITEFGKGEKLVVVRNVTRLHKLEQMRKDFVANVSHELRTPLTVIRGYVETLEMTPNLPEVMQKALSQMAVQGNRMTNLINDLLTLSKLETDDIGVKYRPIKLRPLLLSLASDAEAFSGDRRHVISCDCDEGLLIVGSEKELQSAFSNLIYNAIKYSPPESAVAIKAESHPKGITVSVTDEGSGIDQIHIPRLTERFYRVDESRHSDKGGTGLGLAIVKHVLNRHGAHLSIESQVGKGSTFACQFSLKSVVSR